MKILGTISALRRVCHSAARPLVLVPTMGALHAGHLALIHKARKIAGRSGTVAVSIFVNPIQFNSSIDLASYPRCEGADQRLCKESGVDLIFRPSSVKQLYCSDHSVFVDEEALSSGLCGAVRPGHFRGVCTVVTKLFNLFYPNAAVFGAKDYQQLAIIRRMVRDLNFPVRIIEHPTIREKDGLAMSSRNARLSIAARVVAPGIYKALLRARANAQKQSAREVVRNLKVDLNLIPNARIDYADCLDAASLRTITDWTHSAIIAVAIFLDGVRLIDNIRIPTRKT
ncbi:MAG: pantoate--beta-alanine ligase [Verrucomicrobia bacterium]|nr:MAG: pantoate--beta-alanine ligase [Verrucomicrobiota bacterium]